MNTSGPLVSIVIPVYNGADYLREAIDSALAQTYTNIEVIVVNDGSRDDGATERIALSYGGKIRYFCKENGGVASALNLAISKMSGEYFSWLSHDDLYSVDKIAKQVQALARASSARTIVYGNFAVFSDDPSKAREVLTQDVSFEKFRYFLTTDNSIHGCTLLIPRKAFDECGNFNEKLRTTQDYDLWFRLAGKYRFVHVDALLVKARHHAAQGSVTMSEIALEECNDLLKHFVLELSEAELTSVTSNSSSLGYARIAANFIRRGFYRASEQAQDLARKNLCKSSWGDAMQVIGILCRIKLVDQPRARVRSLFAKVAQGGR